MASDSCIRQLPLFVLIWWSIQVDTNIALWPISSTNALIAFHLVFISNIAPAHSRASHQIRPLSIIPRTRGLFDSIFSLGLAVDLFSSLFVNDVKGVWLLVLFFRLYPCPTSIWLIMLKLNGLALLASASSLSLLGLRSSPVWSRLHCTVSHWILSQTVCLLI